jgi:hypothetical protein
MAGFALLGGVFLAILSAFYLKQIPGKDDIEALSKDLQAQFGPFLEPEQPLEVKIVPAEREGQQMSIRVRCVLRQKLPLQTAEPQRDVLRQMGELTMIHPSWVGKVAFASIENQSDPKLIEKVLPRPVERLPKGAQRADRKPSKG